MAPLSPAPLRRSHPVVRALLAATFPDYRGRKVSAVLVDDRPLSFDLHYDGGSRDVLRLVRLADGAVGVPTVPSPWDMASYAAHVVPAGHALVVHSMFCGTDAGVRVYVRPDAAPALGAGPTQVVVDGTVVAVTRRVDAK